MPIIGPGNTKGLDLYLPPYFILPSRGLKKRACFREWDHCCTAKIYFATEFRDFSCGLSSCTVIEVLSDPSVHILISLACKLAFYQGRLDAPQILYFWSCNCPNWVKFLLHYFSSVEMMTVFRFIREVFSFLGNRSWKEIKAISGGSKTSFINENLTLKSEKKETTEKQLTILRPEIRSHSRRRRAPFFSVVKIG